MRRTGREDRRSCCSSWPRPGAAPPARSGSSSTATSAAAPGSAWRTSAWTRWTPSFGTAPAGLRDQVRRQRGCPGAAGAPGRRRLPALAGREARLARHPLHLIERPTHRKLRADPWDLPPGRVKGVLERALRHPQGEVRAKSASAWRAAPLIAATGSYGSAG